ncbi:MAG TPA: penicillin acylase family protein [Candidatus Binatia bacterium]
MKTLRLAAPVAAVLAMAAAVVASADDNGLFLNILPPGNNGYMTTGEALAFLNDGTVPANFNDQTPIYAALTYAAPGITDDHLTSYFKPAPLTPSGNPPDSPKPTLPGLSITRDDFGVPNIQASNRADVMYGIGWASAADRLFSMDVARHAGRGRISEFVGYDPALIDEDRGVYAFAGYDEADFQDQYDAMLANNGGLGKRTDSDITNFVAGINAFILKVNLGQIQPPVEYGALDELPVQEFKKTDVLAVAVFLEYLFGAGGGAEDHDVALLGELQTSLGASQGAALYRDLRSLDDPDAPVTTDLPFQYMTQGTIDPNAVAVPDTGSEVQHPAVEVVGAIPSARSPSTSQVAALLKHATQPSMSNFLAVTAAKAVGGHPILVGGPQTSYLIPELLYEFSVDSGGLKTRGVAPIGSPYVVLGRGLNYAFTATAGGSDDTDVRAELLCNLDHSPPTTSSTSYMFNGTCTAMTQRTDTWCAGGGSADPTFCSSHPDNVQAVVQRTRHGNVFARATVGGQPIALVHQRASFEREGENALAFQKINKNTPTAKSFLKSISKAPGSFNWLYVNQDDLFYFHSGLLPIRADGVDYDKPSWGTGQWEWKGFITTAQHPQELNPAKGYATSWNNKPAHGWRSSDSNFGYTSTYRSAMLNTQITAALAGGPVTPGNVVEAMGNAGFTDLRGEQVLPYALQIIGSEPSLAPELTLLNDWVTAGTQRRDRDHNGVYDNDHAVAIMDAWFPHMIDQTVGPQLSSFYSDIPLEFDNKPGAIGSAYQDGYYGILKKVLRMALGQSVGAPYEVLHCADGTQAGCRTALVNSLQAAVNDLTTQFSSSDPSTWTVDSAGEEIEFRPFGLATVPGMPWINRPTFQQCVQVTAKH